MYVYTSRPSPLYCDPINWLFQLNSLAPIIVFCSTFGYLYANAILMREQRSLILLLVSHLNELRRRSDYWTQEEEKKNYRTPFLFGINDIELHKQVADCKTNYITQTLCLLMFVCSPISNETHTKKKHLKIDRQYIYTHIAMEIILFVAYL